MKCFICVACGTQFAPSPLPPTTCPICTDDRQAVGRDGQQWTTLEQLQASNRVRIEPDGDLIGVGLAEPFAIPQRALLVRGATLSVLWDCISVVTDEAVASLKAHGGVDVIAISHPHFYSSMVEWSKALGDIPILLHEQDREWVQRPTQRIELWNGEHRDLADDVTLVHLPGHFPGSAALHWTDSASGRRALLVGDSLHVASDRQHITVMHSVPNYLPVGPATIDELRRRLAGLEFDDLYGFTWGLNIIGHADEAVERSLERYLNAISRPRDALLEPAPFAQLRGLGCSETSRRCSKVICPQHIGSAGAQG